MDNLAKIAFPFMMELQDEQLPAVGINDICENQRETKKKCPFVNLAGHFFACAMISETLSNFLSNLNELNLHISELLTLINSTPLNLEDKIHTTKDLGTQPLAISTYAGSILKTITTYEKEKPEKLSSNDAFPFISKTNPSLFPLEKIKSSLDKVIEICGTLDITSKEDASQGIMRQHLIPLQKERLVIENILNDLKEARQKLKIHILRCYTEYFTKNRIGDNLTEKLIGETKQAAIMSGIWDDNYIP